MTSWPETNELAWFRLDCCDAAHPTRIEDHVDDYCIVGGPIPIHHPPAALPRDTFILGWSNGSGNYEQPVRLVEHREDPLPLWTVEMDGVGQQTQRRRFFRVETDICAQLHLLQSKEVTIAQVRDISEGGMRVRIEDFALNPGNRSFQVVLPLGLSRHTLLAHVVRWGVTNGTHRDVGIEFIEPERATRDAVRAYVFRVQIEGREAP